MNIARLSDKNLDSLICDAATVLKSGGLVVMPTDTVYGVAAHPDFPEAVRKIFKVKGRAESKPIAFLASDFQAVETFGAAFSHEAGLFARRFWPGALTLVLRCKSSAMEGFRVPASLIAREIISACGGLLRVTSANISGEGASASLDGSALKVAQSVDMAIDAGHIPNGVPSTVVMDAPDGWKVLREGAITRQSLEQALKT